MDITVFLLVNFPSTTWQIIRKICSFVLNSFRDITIGGSSSRGGPFLQEEELSEEENEEELSKEQSNEGESSEEQSSEEESMKQRKPSKKALDKRTVWKAAEDEKSGNMERGEEEDETCKVIADGLVCGRQNVKDEVHCDLHLYPNLCKLNYL